MSKELFKILIFAIILPLVAQDSTTVIKLNTFEDKALRDGFRAISQELKMESVEWEMKHTAAGYFPSVDYSLNFTKLDYQTVEGSNASLTAMENLLGIDLSNSPTALHENSFTHKFSLSQPITNGGVEIIAIKIAKDMKQASLYQMQAELQQIRYDARKAYLTTISAYEQLILAKEILDWVKKNLKLEEVRFNSASSSITDLLTWQSKLIEKESELFDAQEKYNLSRQKMVSMIGEDATKFSAEDINISSFKEFEMLFPKTPLAVTKGVENSPNVLALNLLSNIAEKEKKIAITPYLPRVNGFASYEWPASEKFIPEQKRSWAVGAVMNLSLFSGFRNYTNLKKVSYDYQKTLIDEKNSIAQLQLNLKRIELALKTFHSSTQAMKESMALMKKNLDIMQERYDGGLVNQTQFFEVAIGYKQARLGYIHKLLMYLILESEYHLVIGDIKELM